MNQTPFRRTTTPRRRPSGRKPVVATFVLLGVIIAAFLAFRSGSSGELAARAGQAQVAAAAPAEKVAVAAAPCPYCGQDPGRWRQLTGVAPPQISGQAAAVVEGACGRLIYGLRQDEQYPPASIAKIVTALVVVEQGRLTDRVDINRNGWDLAAEDGSSIAG